MEINIHAVTSVKVQTTKELVVSDTGKKFFHRYIVVETSKGETLTLVLFADTLENLDIQS